MMETSTQHNTIITPSMTSLLYLMMICGQLMLKASWLMPVLITSTNLPTWSKNEHGMGTKEHVIGIHENWHVLALLNIYAFKQNSSTGDQELCYIKCFTASIISSANIFIHVNKELPVFNLHIEICHRKLGWKPQFMTCDQISILVKNIKDKKNFHESNAYCRVSISNSKTLSHDFLTKNTWKTMKI